MSINKASLKVKYLLQLLRVLKLERIFHQHNVAILDGGRVYCKDAKNFSENGVFVCLEMIDEGW